MNVRQLDRKSDIIKEQERKSIHHVRTHQEKLQRHDQERGQLKESFHKVREQLIEKNRNGASVKEQEHLMKALMAKREALSKQGEVKKTLQEELKELLMQKAKIKKKKEKVLELLDKAKLREKQPQVEYQEEELSLKRFVNEKETLVEKESELNLIDTAPLKERDYTQERFQLQGDQLQGDKNTFTESFANQHHHLPHHHQQQNDTAQAYQGNGQDAPSANQQEIFQSYESLRERLVELNSWSSNGSSHLSCAYELSSGARVGLSIDCGRDGKLSVFLQPQSEGVGYRMGHVRAELVRELTNAGFVVEKVAIKKFVRKP